MKTITYGLLSFLFILCSPQAWAQQIPDLNELDIVGRIVDSRTGKGIIGAEVSINGAITNSVKKGEFLLPLKEVFDSYRQDFEVKVNIDGYLPYTGTERAIPIGKELRFNAIKLVKITYPSLSGFVMDDSSGSGIGGVRISYPTGEDGFSDSVNGSFEIRFDDFEGLPPIILLKFEHEDYQPLLFEFDRAKGTIQSKRIYLRKKGKSKAGTLQIEGEGTGGFFRKDVWYQIEGLTGGQSINIRLWKGNRKWVDEKHVSATGISMNDTWQNIRLPLFYGSNKYRLEVTVAGKTASSGNFVLGRRWLRNGAILGLLTGLGIYGANLVKPETLPLFPSEAPE